MLTVETVNICNNKCIICPYTVQTRARKTMSMKVFHRIVDEYASVGGGPISLTPMVGEIFLDKFLPERLRLLRSTPAIKTISATTNATMAHRYDDAALAENSSARSAGYSFRSMAWIGTNTAPWSCATTTR